MNGYLKIGIRHNVDRWSIEVKGEEIGYFPDSHWGGRYTESGLVQWFGEAVTPSDVPCSEIGNGKWAEQRRAAKFTRLFLFNGPLANVQEYPEQQYYSTEKLSNTAMRFGGPGGPC